MSQEAVLPSSPGDIALWAPEKVGAALEQRFTQVMAEARRQIDWYTGAAVKRGRTSRTLRLASIVCATLGTLAPLLFLPILKDDSSAYLSTIGYVLLALAAAIYAGDTAFGCSSSWMRFRLVETELRRVISMFELDWSIAMAKLAGRPPGPDEAEMLLRLQRGFLDQVIGITERETQLWAQEFRLNLMEFAKSYKIQASAVENGSLIITVDNADKSAVDVEISVDGQPAGKVQGNIFKVDAIAAGLHSVLAEGKIDGQSVYARGSTVIFPQKTSTMNLVLS